MTRLAALGALLLLMGCAAEPDHATSEATDEAVVARARAVHGVDRLDHATVSFTFRDDAFEVHREGGRFAYRRLHTDSLGRTVADVLDNDGLRRTVDGEPTPLGEAAGSAETALNSVVYFALLPYNLADPAVRLRSLGADTIRAEPYDRVEVTFAEQGGGADWEDRFVYWFHAERGTMDYLAYRFHTGDGGTRFREAINPRTVAGIRFADYRNVTADPDSIRLEEYPRRFEAGTLRAVSEVALGDLRVTLRE